MLPDYFCIGVIMRNDLEADRMWRHRGSYDISQPYSTSVSRLLSATHHLPHSPRPRNLIVAPPHPSNFDNWILGSYRTCVALLAAGSKECRQGFSGMLKHTQNSCEYPSKHCITPPRCISMAFFNQESLSHSASCSLCVLARFAVHCCVSKLY